MKNLIRAVVFAALGAAVSPSFAAEQPSLQPGDLVAVVGDSITEQKAYSVFIETYLLACQPAKDLRAMQFGWGGETASGFKSRMVADCFRFKPTVATTCYGMNDGGYSPMDPNKANNYRANQTAIVQGMKKAGVRVIVVGSPGCVDKQTYRKDPAQAEMYNKTLAAERDIAKEVATKEGVIFANVFDPMVDVMTKSEAKYGKSYHLAGTDGVHPNQNGHLVMAYAFLKALNVDGNIGTITFDLSAGKAEATEGHKVLNTGKDSVEVESTRYPFCFKGDKLEDPASTRGILEFLPFNQDLNRLMLVVKGTGEKKYKVTWGVKSKTFAGADLEKGINLAAEFLDNPFSAQFDQLQGAVFNQQVFETMLVKQMFHDFAGYKKMLPDDAATLDKVLDNAGKKAASLGEAAKAKVTPVKHRIKIETAE